MPGTMVYLKTQAGHDEVGASALRLDPPTRRVLIMIDGQRDASTLQRVLGSQHDIGQTLERLEAAGLIEPISQAGKPPATTGMLGRLFKRSGPAPSQLDDAALARVAMARELIADAFGPDGDSLCTRIEDCRDPEALEACLQSTATLIESARSKAVAERFRLALGLPVEPGPG